MTLGLCMIVKDEAAVLGRCLDSAAGVFDEIVIVDTGSTDETKTIARRYTKDVYDFAWRQDFAAARNFGFDRAAADYCMWMDADEILRPDDAAALRALKQTLCGKIGRYFLRTVIPAEDGRCALTFERGAHRAQSRRPLAGTGCTRTCSRAAQPPMRRSASPTSASRRASPSATCASSRGPLPTAKSRTRGQVYYFARELADCGLYAAAADAFRYFLQGDGWAEDKIAACLALARCLRALQRPREAEQALLQSFACAPPRAEACCALGDLCREAGRLRDAVFWYQLALDVGPTRGSALPTPTAAGSSPACGCACVTTASGRGSAPAAGTSKPRGTARRTRASCKTAPTSPARCRAGTDERETIGALAKGKRADRDS